MVIAILNDESSPEAQLFYKSTAGLFGSADGHELRHSEPADLECARLCRENIVANARFDDSARYPIDPRDVYDTLDEDLRAAAGGR